MYDALVRSLLYLLHGLWRLSSIAGYVTCVCVCIIGCDVNHAFVPCSSIRGSARQSRHEPGRSRRDVSSFVELNAVMMNANTAKVALSSYLVTEITDQPRPKFPRRLGSTTYLQSYCKTCRHRNVAARRRCCWHCVLRRATRKRLGLGISHRTAECSVASGARAMGRARSMVR